MASPKILSPSHLHPDSALRFRPWIHYESPYLSNTGILVSRPPMSRVYSSPPLSPTKSRPTVGMSELHPSGAVSRPVTPIQPPAFFDLRSSLPSPPLEAVQDTNTSLAKDGYPAKLLQFPFQEHDYELLRGRQLGSGRFSNVYRAESCAPKEEPSHITILTPPATPIRGSFDGPQASEPPLYAVKVPADRSSVSIIRHEADILSYLHSQSSSAGHIVPFHGLDTRNNGLVLTALPATLESLISDLNNLPSELRATTAASLFLPIARSLTTTLHWLHAQRIIHADIKPANILLSPHTPLLPHHSLLDVPFTPLLSDFTSSFHASAPPNSTLALGGGTYDYLAPELLCRPYPDPDAKSDVYALAMTLLVVVVGRSPFEGASRWVVMEWVKKGMGMGIVESDFAMAGRLKDVNRVLREEGIVDIKGALETGLSKDRDMRILEF